jgi:hypothetical protein
MIISFHPHLKYKIMQKLIITLALFATGFMGTSFTPTQNSDAILGKWYCEELDKSTFQVTKDASGTFTGIIIKSAEPSTIGKIALKDVKYNTGKWNWEGTIISVKRKKELDGVFTLQPNGSLKVVGSMLFFSKTFYWFKVN